MGMFELTWIGLPVTIVGLVYLTTIGQRLLPNREDLLEYAEAHPREYTVELIVRPQCPLVGQSIRKSGLRDLPGLYLYAIERNGERLAPVEPQVKIEAKDLLCFSGVVSTVIDLQKIRGLDPVEHQGDVGPERDSFDSMEGVPEAARAAPRTGRQLCEVVVSPRSPLVGRSVKETDFRARYQASIMAVHRSGQKLSQKIGQIVLQAGDTLLVDAGEDFLRRWRNSPDFILVSGLEDSAPVAHHRAWLALGIFAAVVLGMTLVSEQAVLIALGGAALMIVSGCLPTGQAHRAVELPVLLLIAAALGVSKALDSSGAAEWIAGGVVRACEPLGPIAVLAAFVILTGLLTELLSNNATAALMGSLALATAPKMGMDPRPLLLAVALAASYGFATPIGYQTNLMVLNPGGYRFRDFLRVGIPLDLICWVLTIVLIPLVWPLRLASP
jgi:di/tricarboxylate transporter